MEQHNHKTRFNVFIKAIAIVLAIAFVWQDVVWANPELCTFQKPQTSNLATKTLATNDDRAESFKRFATVYITASISEATKRHPGWASSNSIKNMIEEILARLKDEAQKRGVNLYEDIVEAVQIATGRNIYGTVAIIFKDGDALLFYNPKLGIDPTIQEHLLSTKQIEVDFAVNGNEYLRVQCLTPLVPESRSEESERQARKEKEEKIPSEPDYALHPIGEEGFDEGDQIIGGLAELRKEGIKPMREYRIDKGKGIYRYYLDRQTIDYDTYLVITPIGGRFLIRAARSDAPADVARERNKKWENRKRRNRNIAVQPEILKYLDPEQKREDLPKMRAWGVLPDGCAFLIMNKPKDCTSLPLYIKECREKMTEEERKLAFVNLAFALARSMQHLHINKVIHGEVRPEHVYVRMDEETGRPLCIIMDFSTARIAGAEGPVGGEGRDLERIASLYTLGPEIPIRRLPQPEDEVFIFGYLLCTALARVTLSQYLGMPKEERQKIVGNLDLVIEKCLRGDYENFGQVIADMVMISSERVKDTGKSRMSVSRQAKPQTRQPKSILKTFAIATPITILLLLVFLVSNAWGQDTGDNSAKVMTYLLGLSSTIGYLVFGTAKVDVDKVKVTKKITKKEITKEEIDRKRDTTLAACAGLLFGIVENPTEVVKEALIEERKVYRDCIENDVPLTLKFDFKVKEGQEWTKVFRVGITVFDDGTIVITSVNSCSKEERTTLAKGGCRWYDFKESAGKQILLESTRLAEAMGDKNPLWDVFFDGGKTVFRAAPGVDKKTVIKKWTRSSIISGMLCNLYIAGPDMDMGEKEMVWIQEEAEAVFRERGKDPILATTSRPEKMGSLPHFGWMVTSLGVVESLLAAISDEGIMREHGINVDKENRTVIIQGFGDVGSGIVELLLTVYKKAGFRIIGVSDKFGAIYSKKGLDPDELRRLRKELKKGKEIKLTRDYKKRATRYKNPDDILGKECTAKVLAAGSNIFTRKKGNIGKLRRGCIIVEGANNAFERGLEKELHKMGILYIPGPVANGGGIYTSTEEIIHFYMAKLEGLKRHVLDAIADYSTSITRTVLAEYKKSGYKKSPYEIMRQISGQIRQRKKQLLKAGRRNPAVKRRMDVYTGRGVPKKYALIIAASEIAHDTVYYKDVKEEDLLANLDRLEGEDLASAIFDLGRVISFKERLDSEVREAARVKLLEILNSRSSAVVRRATAEALSYVSEGLSQEKIDDTVKALKKVSKGRGRVAVWARWSLEKLRRLASDQRGQATVWGALAPLISIIGIISAILFIAWYLVMIIFRGRYAIHHIGKPKLKDAHRIARGLRELRKRGQDHGLNEVIMDGQTYTYSFEGQTEDYDIFSAKNPNGEKFLIKAVRRNFSIDDLKQANKRICAPFEVAKDSGLQARREDLKRSRAWGILPDKAAFLIMDYWPEGVTYLKEHVKHESTRSDTTAHAATTKGRGEEAARESFRDEFDEGEPKVLEFLGIQETSAIIKYEKELIPTGGMHIVYKHTLTVYGKDPIVFFTKEWKPEITLEGQDEDLQREEQITNKAYELGIAPKTRLITIKKKPLLFTYECKGQVLSQLDLLEFNLDYVKAIAFALGKLHGAGMWHGDLAYHGLAYHTVFQKKHIFIEKTKDKVTARFIDFHCGRPSHSGYNPDFVQFQAEKKDLRLELSKMLPDIDEEKVETAFSESYESGIKFSKPDEPAERAAHSALAEKIDKMSKPSWVRGLIKSPFIPAIPAHELAHFVMAKILGIELEEKSFMGTMKPKIDPERGPPNKWFYYVGPLANALMIALSVASLVLVYSFCNNPVFFWPLVILSWWSLGANLITFGFEILSKDGDFYKAQRIGFPTEIVSGVSRSHSEGKFFARATFKVSYKNGVHEKYAMDISVFRSYLEKHGIFLSVVKDGERVPADTLHVMSLALILGDEAEFLLESERKLSDEEIKNIFSLIARSFRGLGISEEEDFVTLDLADQGNLKKASSVIRRNPFLTFMSRGMLAWPIVALIAFGLSHFIANKVLLAIGISFFVAVILYPFDKSITFHKFKKEEDWLVRVTRYVAYHLYCQLNSITMWGCLAVAGNPVLATLIHQTVVNAVIWYPTCRFIFRDLKKAVETITGNKDRSAPETGSWKRPDLSRLAKTERTRAIGEVSGGAALSYIRRVAKRYCKEKKIEFDLENITIGEITEEDMAVAGVSCNASERRFYRTAMIFKDRKDGKVKVKFDPLFVKRIMAYGIVKLPLAEAVEGRQELNLGETLLFRTIIHEIGKHAASGEEGVTIVDIDTDEALAEGVSSKFAPYNQGARLFDRIFSEEGIIGKEDFEIALNLYLGNNPHIWSKIDRKLLYDRAMAWYDRWSAMCFGNPERVYCKIRFFAKDEFPKEYPFAAPGVKTILGMINSYTIDRAPNALWESGAVHCNYLFVYDAATKTGAVAHIDLTNLRRLPDDEVVEAACIGIRDMIANLEREGAERRNIQFLIVRTAQNISRVDMLSSYNYMTLAKALQKLGYVFRAEVSENDIVRLSLADGRVVNSKLQELARLETIPDTMPEKAAFDTGAKTTVLAHNIPEVAAQMVDFTKSKHAGQPFFIPTKGYVLDAQTGNPAEVAIRPMDDSDVRKLRADKGFGRVGDEPKALIADYKDRRYPTLVMTRTVNGEEQIEAVISFTIEGDYIKGSQLIVHERNRVQIDPRKKRALKKVGSLMLLAAGIMNSKTPALNGEVFFLSERIAGVSVDDPDKFYDAVEVKKVGTSGHRLWTKSDSEREMERLYSLGVGFAKKEIQNLPKEPKAAPETGGWVRPDLDSKNIRRTTRATHLINVSSTEALGYIRGTVGRYCFEKGLDFDTNNVIIGEIIKEDIEAAGVQCAPGEERFYKTAMVFRDKRDGNKVKVKFDPEFAARIMAYKLSKIVLKTDLPVRIDLASSLVFRTIIHEIGKHVAEGKRRAAIVSINPDETLAESVSSRFAPYNQGARLFDRIFSEEGVTRQEDFEKALDLYLDANPHIWNMIGRHALYQATMAWYDRWAKICKVRFSSGRAERVYSRILMETHDKVDTEASVAAFDTGTLSEGADDYEEEFGDKTKEVLEFLGLPANAPIAEYEKVEVGHFSGLGFASLETRVVYRHILTLSNGDKIVFYTKQYVVYDSADITDSMVEAFQKEVRIMQIAHGLNIAPKSEIIDIGERPFIFMYETEGQSLDEIDPSEIDLNCVEAIGLALGKLHGVEICHNDLVSVGFKKIHIFVKRKEDSIQVRFIDYGRARHFVDNTSSESQREIGQEERWLCDRLSGMLRHIDEGKIRSAFSSGYHIGRGMLAEEEYLKLKKAKQIEENLVKEKIADFLVESLRTLTRLAEERGGKVVLALDTNLTEGDDAKLYLGRIIRVLQGIPKNNATLLSALKGLVIVDKEGDKLPGELDRMADRGKLDKSKDIVIALTAQADTETELIEKGFEEIFITQTNSTDTYLPITEMLLFSLIRALAVYGECDKDELWKWYKKIPYRKEITFVEFKEAYFDGNGDPKRNIILKRIPPAEPIVDKELEDLYRIVETLIRNA